MPKITSQDIIDLGFSAEMFDREDDPDLFFTPLIAEQSAILQGRVGADAYAVAASPTVDYVKRAEKVLVALELLSRQKNRILNNATAYGDQRTEAIRAINEAIADYRNELEGTRDTQGLIAKISAGATESACVFGVLETSHFGDDDA